MKARSQAAPSPLGFYFLLLFSANGKSVFGDDADRRTLNEIVARLVAELQVRIHAHCWLNNEIEVVAETGAVAPERLVRKIAATYADAVNGRLGRNGALFSDSPICYEPQARSELVDIVRSLHIRPVMLDLAEDHLAYPWSSARAYGGFEEVPWLTKTTLGPLMQRDGSTDHPKAQTAPRMIADAVEAKLSREMADRSSVWMARAFVASVVTRNGIATLATAASRLGVDATSLEHSIRKYHEISPDLFETPLSEVMDWRCFEIASPKARKAIADILAILTTWPA